VLLTPPTTSALRPANTTAIANALNTLDGVSRAEADTVEVVADDSVTDDDIHAAIEQAGYEVTA